MNFFHVAVVLKNGMSVCCDIGLGGGGPSSLER